MPPQDAQGALARFGCGPGGRVATSRPAQPRWTPDAPPAEKLLWGWAVDQLDDEVLVLPQVAMTLPDNGRPEEAELDLVLIDPQAGVTVVEVKGGTVSYDADRAVWRRREAGAKEIRDPVAQVKRARSLLRKALAEHRLDPAQIALRWAVATPECRLDAPGGTVLEPELLWDDRGADGLALAYRRTVGSLTLGEEPLGADRADYIARVLRGRTSEGARSLVADIDRHEQTVRFVTESHRNVLHHFAANPHVLVRGAAGTGKTILALEAAAQYASMGARVLLACWNVVLGRWLRQALKARLAQLGSPAADAVTDDPSGRVVVGHLVGLARSVGNDQPAVPVAAEDRADYYHRDLPEQVSPALTGGEFDVVVLDEAQDLSELWVLAVSTLVARTGRWYAFTDRQQDLFGADAALPDFLEITHELTENFRNSRQIAEFAGRFGHIELDCVTGDGPPVQYVAVPQERVVGRTGEIARKLRRDQHLDDADMAVLFLFHNPMKDRNDEVAELVLAGELIETNSASFKGMERPAVVLGLDMDPTKADRADEVGRAIYAAATRARSHLTVVGDPDTAEAYGFAQLARDLRR